MKVVDLANQIFIDAGSPSSTTIAAISFWLRGQIGNISNLLFENFAVNSDYEIVDGDGAEISTDAAAIIQQLYRIYDYEVQVRAQMNALSSDAGSLLEFKEADGSSFRRTNRNEISKTLASIRKDELERLKDLITAYRMKKAAPMQTVGDDTTQGIFGGDLITDLRFKL